MEPGSQAWATGEATLSKPPRKSFSTIKPKLQLAWDSVSLGVAKTCWRKYQYQIIEGWQAKHESLHLRYGQLYHRVDEFYNHRRAEGMEHEAALRATLWDLRDGCCDTVWEKGGHVEGMEPDEVLNTARKVWWNPNEHLSEAKAKLNTKTIANLFRTVIWFLDDAKNDVLKTVILPDGTPAVELSFRYELGFTFRTGEQAMHSGHLDRLASLGDDIYFVDKKTTKNTISGNSSWGFFAKFNPDNQMTGYNFAGKVCYGLDVKGGIIDAAQIAKGFTAFERGFTMRTDGQLEEWRNDVLYFLTQAEDFVDQDYWPMNDTACDNYGGCVFRDVCKRDPQVRHIFLQSDFVKKPWDPLEIRGDI